MNQDLRERMERVLERRFTACMFDFDGTLVERGYHMPVPAYISEVLQEVSRKVPMAVCTTRPFPDAIKHAKELFGAAFDEVKSNWSWFCESGSAGYVYRESTDSYEELYRVPWPQKTMSRLQFEEVVREAFASDVSGMSLHPSVIILRPKDYDGMNGDQMADVCHYLEKKGLALLKDHGLEDTIRLANSSLGVFFFNPEGDKNRGVAEYGAFLRSKGVALDEHLREILVFGDRPMRYGNDEYFLNGELGTAVNVGEHELARTDLISVIDDDGVRLMGPRAVEFLLRRVRFMQ